MTDFQKKIYEGLKSIGEEIANFYEGGLMLIENDKIPSRSYLIAHSAREIDGGIRDILAPISEKKKLQKTLSLEKELKDRKGHIASILVALNLSIDNDFAREYISVAIRFVELTHRRGAYLTSRDSNEIITLWNKYEIILEKLVGNFINQIRQIEHISRFDEPSKEIIPTLKNIFRDNQKEFHFYKNLKSINWFQPLYKNDFFSPETINVSGFWNPSEYLEYLSIEVKEERLPKEVGKELALIVEEILTYSETVEYIKNFRIRYTLLLILTNISKEYISERILSLIPHCIQTEYENLLESSQIFHLYYSYLDDIDDKPKYKTTLEQLTKFIFGITEKEHFKDNSSYDSGKYFSYIRAYRLKDACENPKFINAVASHCSNDIIFYIADNLDKYLEASYEYSTENVFRNNDINSYAYSIKSNFTLILKNASIEKAKISSEGISDILSAFLSNRYKHHRFIQISLFVIAKTWDVTKNIFFDLISQNDKNKIFSNYLISDDLYYFLEEVATKLNDTEIEKIISIIEQGSQVEDFYNHKGEYYDDFRLRWYSALSENKNIQSKYIEVSAKKGKTKSQIHPKNNEFVTHGSISPISKEKIIEMSVNDLVEYLKTFDPERSFRSPSVDGLEGSLTEALKVNPNLFTDNTLLFLKVPYRYIFRIFYALSEIYEEGHKLNWVKILEFIEEYTSQPDFGTENLTLKNVTYPYEYTGVITSFCRLLSKGMRGDENIISKDSLFKVKSILFNFSKKYISLELPEKDIGRLGSAMQVINSTTGVIVGTVLDYSLYKAKLNCKKEENPKWSNEEKNLFTSFAKENIQEFYVRFGWNLGNFFYLDKNWSKELLKSIAQKDLQTRKSFFGGHIINLSSSTFEYESLKSVYEEAVINNWEVVDSTMGNSPVETQLLIFFISGYEDLEDKSLLVKYLEQKNIKSIRGLIHSLSFKFEKYYLNLNLEKQKEFRIKIIRIWEYVLDILEKAKQADQIKDEDRQDFGVLLHLSKYIKKLDENTTNLFLRSSNFTSKSINIEIVLKALNRFKNTGDKKKSLDYSSKIFEKLILKEVYYASILKKEIVEFIEDLYKDGREELKNRADYICNEFAKYGQFELRELYEKYN